MSTRNLGLRVRTRTDAHLVDDTEGLPELLHTAQIPIVAISVLPHGDVEFNLEVHADASAQPPYIHAPRLRGPRTSSYLSYGATFRMSQGTPLPRSMTPLKL